MKLYEYNKNFMVEWTMKLNYGLKESKGGDPQLNLSQR